MRIAIAGYGVEGKASYEYFLRQGHTIAILDEREVVSELPDDALVRLGPSAFSDLERFELVVRSPSIVPSKLRSAKKVWSATNEFFAHCPAPIIGVTGTKGKGTTVSLIAAILRTAGKTVHVVGNIGVPALEVLPNVKSDDSVVYELSSFQLWDAQRSPQVAVVLMIEPDHLDTHADFDEYVTAKTNIVAHQSADDLVVYHPTNPMSANIAAASSVSRKKKYLTAEAAYVHGGHITIDDRDICSTNDVGLLGEYNLENVCAAVSAAWEFTNDTQAIAKAVHEFKGLEHRLEFVAEKQGVRFYNDSFSSNPAASQAAITAFDRPIVLIVGGHDKGLDLTSLAKSIATSHAIKHVILIGQVRDTLASALVASHFASFDVLAATTMGEVVALASSRASKGDVVLLSPGTSSFDMFANFYDRGERFKEAVNALKD